MSELFQDGPCRADVYTVGSSLTRHALDIHQWRQGDGGVARERARRQCEFVAVPSPSVVSSTARVLAITRLVTWKAGCATA